MTELSKMREFLLSYPNWDAGRLLYIDYTDGVPGNCGLFPSGREELSRREDVLGNLRIDYRLNFLLYRVGATPDTSEKDAQWLLEFQEWVQAQSAAGRTPHFGDVPRCERLFAKEGRHIREKRGACSLYGVQLTAEFTKYYEVNEHGEN